MARKKRLLTLARFLRSDKLPDERWDYNTLMSGTHKGGLFEGAIVKDLPKSENFCGTTGCAIGWAGMVPQFRKAGLEAKVYTAQGHVRVELNGDHYQAIHKFFDMTDWQVTRLFYDEGGVDDRDYVKDGDITRFEEADRIEAFARTGLIFTPDTALAVLAELKEDV